MRDGGGGRCRRCSFENALEALETAGAEMTALAPIHKQEQTLVGFDAAVSEETFARSEEMHERLGQPALGFMIVKVRRMNEPAGLLNQRLGDGRMRVAQTIHRNAST